MKLRVLAVATVTTALLAAACTVEQVDLTTTSVLVTGTTTEPTTTTTTTDVEETPTTTLVGQTVESYDVLIRVSGYDGETLYIVIPPGAYTDVDMENFIGDLIEADPGLSGAEVFDNEEAARAYVIPENQRTDEQKQLIEEHHFVSLIGGSTLRFQGPFAHLGEYVIGS